MMRVAFLLGVIICGIAIVGIVYGTRSEWSRIDGQGHATASQHVDSVPDLHGQDGGSEHVDNDFVARSMDGFGAFILGRNMFGPVRGDWPDDEWKGCGAAIRRFTRQRSC